MNPINTIEIYAMLFALCVPLLLALREFICAPKALAKAAALVSQMPRTRRGWTIIKWRDNAPFAGRALRYISSRALAIPHVGAKAGRYSMPDGGAQVKPCTLEDAAAKQSAVMTSPALMRLISHALEHLRYLMNADEVDNFYPGCELGVAAAQELERRGANDLAVRPLYQQQAPVVVSLEPIDNINAVHSIAAGEARVCRLSMPDGPAKAVHLPPSATFAMIELNEDGQKKYRGIDGAENHGCADGVCQGCGDDMWAADPGWIGLPPGYGFLCCLCKVSRRRDFPAGKGWFSRADCSPEDLAIPAPVRLSMPDGAVAARKAADEGGGGRPLPLGDLADQMRERARIAAAAIQAETNNDKRRAWETIRDEANNILRSIREMEEAYKTAGADYPTARYSMPAAPVVAVPWLNGYMRSSAVDGTSRRGCLRGMDEAAMNRVFGASHYGKMWAFANAAGEVFTVYDYKGEQWSIGGYHNGRRGNGKNKMAVNMVHGILQAAGVDCRRRDMLLHGTPFEPVLYVGDLPELPCEAYSWAPEPAPDSPLVSVLKDIRALLVSGWNPPSRGFAINSRGECCHSRDKDMKTMCFAAAMSMAEARERRGTAAERDGRYKVLWQAVHKGADLPPIDDAAPESAWAGAIDEWEKAEGRTQCDILYALDAAVDFVERQQAGGPRFSFAEDMSEEGADADRDIRNLPISEIVAEMRRRGEKWQDVGLTTVNTHGKGVAYKGKTDKEKAIVTGAAVELFNAGWRMQEAAQLVEQADKAVSDIPAKLRYDMWTIPTIKEATARMDEALKRFKWSVRRPRSGETIVERAERIVKDLTGHEVGSLDAINRDNLRGAIEVYRKAAKATKAACPRYSFPGEAPYQAIRYPNIPGDLPLIAPPEGVRGVRAVLLVALRLLRRRGWTKGEFARGNWGCKAYSYDTNAACYCAEGALTAATVICGEGEKTKSRAIAAVMDAIYGKNKDRARTLHLWNDAATTKADDVFAAFGAAARKRRVPAALVRFSMPEAASCAECAESGVGEADDKCYKCDKCGKGVCSAHIRAYGFTWTEPGLCRECHKYECMKKSAGDLGGMLWDLVNENPGAEDAVAELVDRAARGRKSADAQVPAADDAEAWARNFSIRLSMPDEDVKTLATCPKCGADAGEGKTIDHKIPGGGLAAHCLDCGHVIRCHCDRDPQMEGKPPEPCERCGGWREVEGEIEEIVGDAARLSMPESAAFPATDAAATAVASFQCESIKLGGWMNENGYKERYGNPVFWLNFCIRRGAVGQGDCLSLTAETGCISDPQSRKSLAWARIELADGATKRRTIKAKGPGLPPIKIAADAPIVAAARAVAEHLPPGAVLETIRQCGDKWRCEMLHKPRPGAEIRHDIPVERTRTRAASPRFSMPEAVAAPAPQDPVVREAGGRCHLEGKNGGKCGEWRIESSAAYCADGDEWVEYATCQKCGARFHPETYDKERKPALAFSMPDQEGDLPLVFRLKKCELTLEAQKGNPDYPYWRVSIRREKTTSHKCGNFYSYGKLWQARRIYGLLKAALIASKMVRPNPAQDDDFFYFEGERMCHILHYEFDPADRRGLIGRRAYPQRKLPDWHTDWEIPERFLRNVLRLAYAIFRERAKFPEDCPDNTLVWALDSARRQFKIGNYWRKDAVVDYCIRQLAGEGRGMSDDMNALLADQMSTMTHARPYDLRFRALRWHCKASEEIARGLERLAANVPDGYKASEYGPCPRERLPVNCRGIVEELKNLRDEWGEFAYDFSGSKIEAKTIAARRNIAFARREYGEDMANLWAEEAAGEGLRLSMPERDEVWGADIDAMQRAYNPPPPKKTFPCMGCSTPWGEADEVIEVAPGIVEVGTPGHGGIWLSAARAKRIPGAGIPEPKGGAWFEEDLDYNIAIALHPAPFSKRDRGRGSGDGGAKATREAALRRLELFYGDDKRGEYAEYRGWLKAFRRALTGSSTPPAGGPRPVHFSMPDGEGGFTPETLARIAESAEKYNAAGYTPERVISEGKEAARKLRELTKQRGNVLCPDELRRLADECERIGAACAEKMRELKQEEAAAPRLSMPSPPEGFEEYTAFIPEVRPGELPGTAHRPGWMKLPKREHYGKISAAESVQLHREAEDAAQGKAQREGDGTEWRVIKETKKRVASGTFQRRPRLSMPDFICEGRTAAQAQAFQADYLSALDGGASEADAAKVADAREREREQYGIAPESPRLSMPAANPFPRRSAAREAAMSFLVRHRHFVAIITNPIKPDLNRRTLNPFRQVILGADAIEQIKRMRTNKRRARYYRMHHCFRWNARVKKYGGWDKLPELRIVRAQRIRQYFRVEQGDKYPPPRWWEMAATGRFSRVFPIPILIPEKQGEQTMQTIDESKPADAAAIKPSPRFSMPEIRPGQPPYHLPDRLLFIIFAADFVLADAKNAKDAAFVARHSRGGDKPVLCRIEPRQLLCEKWHEGIAWAKAETKKIAEKHAKQNMKNGGRILPRPEFRIIHIRGAGAVKDGQYPNVSAVSAEVGDETTAELLRIYYGIVPLAHHDQNAEAHSSALDRRGVRPYPRPRFTFPEKQGEPPMKAPTTCMVVCAPEIRGGGVIGVVPDNHEAAVEFAREDSVRAGGESSPCLAPHFIYRVDKAGIVNPVSDENGFRHTKFFSTKNEDVLDAGLAWIRAHGGAATITIQNLYADGAAEDYEMPPEIVNGDAEHFLQFFPDFLADVVATAIDGNTPEGERAVAALDALRQQALHSPNENCPDPRPEGHRT